MRHSFTAVFCIATTLAAHGQTIRPTIDRGDIPISDFEGATYSEWVNEGDAFAVEPLPTSVLLGWGDSGFEGKAMATSYSVGDAGTGSFTSPEFTIQRRFINFLVGGGANIDNVHIALMVDGREVKLTAGYNRRTMAWECWDVAVWRGKKAHIRMTDNSREGWGFINADFFSQSDMKREQPTVTRRITVSEDYLNFPVRTGAIAERMEIMNKGALLHDMEIELDGADPDFWVSLNSSQWKGKEIEMRIIDSGKTAEGIKGIYQSAIPAGHETFYKESLRPRVHFTSQRGWLNDPNGLVWSEGEWHLFYQHNPYGVAWGNMTWGHAVSPDLVHWKELGDALHPDALGPMFSGSAVVDSEGRLVAVYTSAGGVGFRTHTLKHTQSIAYSSDRGRTWTKYENNPVIPTITRYNRDPKVIRHEPSGKWVMALYLDKQEYMLLTSPDLKNWTEADRFVLEGADECPDFFDMAVEGNPGVRKWVFTGANSTYLVGDFDGTHFTPETKPQRIDNGANYYAVQTYSNAPDDRRVQFAWMNGSIFGGMPFNQQISFPRELTLHRTDGGGYIIKSTPVAEIENLYCGRHEWRNVTTGVASGDITSSFRGNVFHLRSMFDLEASENEPFGLDIDGFIVEYRPGENKLVVSLRGGVPIRQFELPSEDGRTIKIDILSDTGSIEVFVNEGEIAGAFYYLPERREGRIELLLKGRTLLKSLVVDDLKPFWKQ